MLQFNPTLCGIPGVYVCLTRQFCTLRRDRRKKEDEIRLVPNHGQVVKVPVLQCNSLVENDFVCVSVCVVVRARVCAWMCSSPAPGKFQRYHSVLMGA